MAFFKSFGLVNGATATVHEIIRIEVVANARVVVNSYSDEQAFASKLLLWQDQYPIPMNELGAAEAWLVSTEGPFAGGSLLEAVTPLGIAQTIRQAQLKAERDRREVSGFAYLGKFFDSDQKAYNRMIGATASAQAAIAGALSFSIVWTLADNTTLEMDAEDVMGMLPALASMANGLNVTYNSLKALIAAAETVEQVNSVQWPIA